MTPEQIADKWKEICFILSKSVSQDMIEKEFEYHVVRAIETLGWKEFKNEIKRQPVIPMGHGGKLQPDLVVYDTSSEPLIAIEVKRPAEDLTKDSVSNQLKSYMLMLKVDYGLLIGGTIRFFYDGPSNPQKKEPILLGEFKFDEKSEAGERFVSNINKESLTQKNHIEYLDNLISKVKKNRSIEKLIQELVSKNTKENVLIHLKSEFSDYGSEILGGALKSVDIQINRKVPEKPSVDVSGPKSKPNTIKGKVLDLIQTSQEGVRRKEICHKLNLSDKQVANIIYRFQKHGQIKKSDIPGVWVATHSPPIQKHSTTQQKTTIKTKGLREKVFKTIARYKNGTSAAKIRERTGFNKKQVSNSIYRLLKRGKITRIKPGFYKAV